MNLKHDQPRLCVATFVGGCHGRPISWSGLTLMVGVAMASAVARWWSRGLRYADYRHRLVSALLRCHHENTAWHEGDLLAPTLWALRSRRFVLRDGLGALEPFSALLATVLIGRHEFLRCVAPSPS